MGQAIVYCSNCSARLRDADFEARKAFKVDDLVFCVKCCREVLGKEPDAPLTSSSARTKVPAPSKPLHSSSPIPFVAPPPPDSGGGSGLYIGLGVGGAVAVLIAVAAMSGGRPAAPAPSTPSPIAVSPSVAPGPSVRESSAEQALAKALRTENLDTRRALLAEAVAQAAGTPLFNDAQRELDRVERQLNEQRAAAENKAAARVKPDPLVKVPVPALPDPASTPSPPTPPPPSPDRSREEAAASIKWQAALAPATGRDYAASIAALEKLGGAASDIALLKSASLLLQEALAALVRTPKGQKVALEHRDAGGELRRVEASFLDSGNGRVEVRNDSATVELELGEILPSSLVDLLRSRGTAVDPLTSAILCLMEGDEAGARRLAGSALVPDRFWTFGRNVPRSDAARTLYRDALTLENGFATAADAVPKYQALLRDHGDSSFVMRNKASLAARVQVCARDFLFVPPDLKPAGTFKAFKSAKGFTCWSSEADSDASKLKENFIELSYSALADATYRCWIYAGGCCQETFEFGVQGTEMKSGKDKEPIEPNSGGAATIKLNSSSLKKAHSGHTGPKQPSHWEWVAVPLPKYSRSGPQQLRILTIQKGFSVAFACVSATRSNPPRELEMKELEKARGGLAVAPPGETAAKSTAGPAGTVVYSENFDAGAGKFSEGEWVDGGVKGTKAYAIPMKGVGAWNAWSVSAKDSSTISFKVKPLGDVSGITVLIWSDKLQDNGRVTIEGLKKGEWKDVRLKVTDFHIGASGEGRSVDVCTNIKIFLLGSAPDTKVLLDDFEIRE